MKNADIKSRHQQDIGRFPNGYKKNKITRTNNQDKNKKFECKITREEIKTPFSLFQTAPKRMETFPIYVRGGVKSIIFESRGKYRAHDCLLQDKKLHSTRYHFKKKITEHGDL